jgi:hypothetical protein
MNMLLLPQPRQMTFTGGRVDLPEHATITISAPQLLFEAQQAQAAVKQAAGCYWPIRAGATSEQFGLSLVIEPGLPPQSYRLRISESGITLAGGDHAGVFYGVCTLRQLLTQDAGTLQLFAIEDSPDFPVRGVMVDVSRNRVPTMVQLYALVDRLASWKINQIQLYVEHTFAYSQHAVVWRTSSPLTGQEILELDAYCRRYHIDLVPNQNSLGHMENWLKHPAYKNLAECPDGFIGDFGDHMGERRPATSLNPVDPASIQFIAGLYNELLPHFTSSLFNVGGDEPWEMGQCRSRAEVQQFGRGRIYVDYLCELHRLADKHGRQMMFWADVIVKYPDLLPDMPRDVIALEWGYSADHPYAAHAPMFAESGLQFYVVPGTSSWNSLAGRSNNTVANITDAAENGLKYGASGLLITDWGDRGHWQPPAVSWLGFAYGAGLAWSLEANRDMPLSAVLDRFAFADRAGIMGQVTYDLGNLYTLPGLSYPNGSLLFFLLQLGQGDLNMFITNLDQQVVSDQFFGIRTETMLEGISRIDNALQQLNRSDMDLPDSCLILDEFAQVAHLLRHACQRGLFLNGSDDVTADHLLADLEALIPQQRLNWLARSRPGGLKESMSRFEPVLRDYRAIVGDTPSYL